MDSSNSEHLEQEKQWSETIIHIKNMRIIYHTAVGKMKNEKTQSCS